MDFEEYRFDAAAVRNVVETYVFTNGRPITKSMLAWWAYNDESQQLMPLDVTLEIEHVFSRKRQENERSLTDKNNLESLGNKILLEKSINIRASDYRFLIRRNTTMDLQMIKESIKRELEILNLL